MRKAAVSLSDRLVDGARTGNLALVEDSLSRGADPNSVDKRFKIPCVTIAAIRGDLDVVRVLLRDGADPLVEDPYDKWTPVDYAKWFGRKRIASVIEAQVKLRKLKRG